MNSNQSLVVTGVSSSESPLTPAAFKLISTRDGPATFSRLPPIQITLLHRVPFAPQEDK
jgi:hypothetical protein